MKKLTIIIGLLVALNNIFYAQSGVCLNPNILKITLDSSTIVKIDNRLDSIILDNTYIIEPFEEYQIDGIWIINGDDRIDLTDIKPVIYKKVKRN